MMSYMFGRALRSRRHQPISSPMRALLGRELRGISAALSLAVFVGFSGYPTPSQALSALPKKIVVDEEGVVFLLDESGYVWAFSDPWSMKGKFKIQGLKDIVDISPYIAVDRSGSVFSWDSKVSIAGDIDNAEGSVKYHKAKTENLKDVYLIAYGNRQFFAVNNAGIIYQWRRGGRYNDKDLGPILGGVSPSPAFQARQKVIGAASSGYHVVFITDDNIIHGWGLNHLRQLGNDKRRYVEATNPVEISVPGVAKKIQATSWFTMVLTDDGQLLQWGACGVNGNIVPGSVSDGRSAYFEDIGDFAVDPGSDWQRYVLRRRNGDMWLAYPAIPSMMESASHCHGGGRGIEPDKKATVTDRNIISLATSVSRLSWARIYAVDALGKVLFGVDKLETLPK